MAWSTWQADTILDNFTIHPGIITIVQPGNIVHNPMSRLEAEHVATAIRERAATRGIPVAVTTQSIVGEPRYANVAVKHLVDESPLPVPDTENDT